MKILVIGAGRAGARAVRQLKKNPEIEILTADPHKSPYAVQQDIIQKVDYIETVTPLNLDYLLDQAQPDLVLLATTTEDLGLGEAPGLDMLADALREELVSISEVPIIEVARTGL
jgi:dihydrodipicolinate reductase